MMHCIGYSIGHYHAGSLRMIGTDSVTLRDERKYAYSLLFRRCTRASRSEITSCRLSTNRNCVSHYDDIDYYGLSAPSAPVAEDK